MEAFKGVIAVFSALIVLAIIATLVGSNAKTGEIFTSIFNGLATGIKAAEAPVTGGGISTSNFNMSNLP